MLPVACALVAIVIGCNSESTGPTDVSTFENPYDWVGEMHNKGLDYTLELAGEDPDHDWTSEEVGNLAAQYYKSQSKDERLPTGAEDMDFPSLTAVSLAGRHRYTAFLDSLYEAGVVSDHFRSFAEAALDLCERGDRDGLAGLAEEVHSSAVADEERVILLATISIGWHSLGYWSRGAGAGRLRSAQMVHPVAAADVVGAAVGGLSTWWNNRNSGHSDWMDIAGGALIGGLGASTLGFLRVG
jgi:hypothetical protein